MDAGVTRRIWQYSQMYLRKRTLGHCSEDCRHGGVTHPIRKDDNDSVRIGSIPLSFELHLFFL